jgi:PAS domain S-box-containing protein
LGDSTSISEVIGCGGEMAERVEAFDWSQTPLGPRERWPEELRVAVDICLSSRFPMFVWWGPELINIYNDAYVPMLGKRHPAALGRKARDSWDDIWSVVGPQADAVMLRGEATWNERVRLVMERKGYWEDTYFTWSYSPIRDKSGRVGGLYCAVTEETERVRVEADRDRLAAQRQLALNAARMGWWHYDPATRITTFDQRYADILCISGPQRPNDEILKRLHPDDLPDERTRIDAALNTADPKLYSAEYRILLDDGTVRWIEAHGVTKFEGSGPDRRATSLVGTIADVTERKHAEQLLAAQNRALELIATGAPLPDALGALTGAVEMQSGGQAVAAILLVGEDGCSLYTGAAPSLPPEYSAAIDGIKAKRGVGTCADAAARNQIVMTPDLAAAPSWRGLAHLPLALGLKAAWSMPIRGSDGRVLGTFGTYFRECREPSARERQIVEGLSRAAALAIERKQAEEDRRLLLDSERAARADAERASRMKDDFLATLSHELRTPLNAVLGWSQVLAMGNNKEDELVEGLRTIERNARAQAQIIEDLLDMSRIVNGKVRLDVQRIGLEPIIRAAIEAVAPVADAKGVRIESVLDPQAGPVSGDSARLQQVFWNLLTNAVKFTPRGGRVQVVLQRVNSHVEASVTDSGEGIRPEFLPHVFDRFRQADATTTRRHGGLGLGLAIVKQLVELHGGMVRAQSAGDGLGSTFTISLPVIVIQSEVKSDGDRRHPSADVDDDAPAPLVDVSENLAGVKVLVVDDEPDTRALVARLLKDRMASVITAGSAAEALDKIQAERPDVLVSDIGMPNEDGYTLMRRVRSLGAEHGGNVTAIALTAYARAEDRMRSIRAGFQLHIPKPVEPAELITMVAALARR